jgi:hypothetical protein
MFFCADSLLTSFATELSGTMSSAPPCTIRPEDGQGARNEKSNRLAGGAIDTKPSISGRRISSCMLIQARTKSGDQQAAAFWLTLQPVGAEAGRKAASRCRSRLAAPDASEIDAQHRKPVAGEGVIGVVDDLVVHRAAVSGTGWRTSAIGALASWNGCSGLPAASVVDDDVWHE